ncbi:hypothetical protein V8Z74_14600 [Comamonas sp. w2-DMI]|uniref:hypothetical protein n=1 Tax=Comamonas sp. w2-DMI TaxID=3126391 RepID=UPI0032E4E22D
MSGFSIPLSRRQRCEASGKPYTRYLRAGVPDEHNMLNCPSCGKRVTLRPKDSTGQAVVIPRHLERIIGL